MLTYKDYTVREENAGLK